MHKFVSYLLGIFVCFCFLYESCENKEKKENTTIDRVEVEQDRELAEKNWRWVEDNKVTARNLAKKFAQDKGYTIQSIHATSNNAGDYYASEITWAYYSYRIITGDISNSGGLIDIGVRVKYDKYESPNWTIDYFQAYN